MGSFICQQCRSDFQSKRSNAKFCSRSCAGKRSGALPSKSFSREELVEFMVVAFEETGKVPSKRYWDGKTPSHTTFRKVFGTYSNAVEAAGLIPNMRYSEKILKDERRVGPRLRFLILSRDNFACVYCGATPLDGATLHVDHKVPFSKGGETAEENLQTTCWLCNMGKSDMMV